MQSILNIIPSIMYHTTPISCKSIWVIVTLRNAEKWIEYSLESILSQECELSVKIAICDDNSSDNSPIIIKNIINKYPAKKEDIFFIQNTERKYKLKNICHMLNTLPIELNDIVVFLDGDDFLSSTTSLQTVFNAYKHKGCWVTYGSYKPLRGEGCCCREMTSGEKEKNDFRNMAWLFSHLFTFRYFLWKSIPSSRFIFEDKYNYMYTYAPDQILNLEICEFAKSSRIHFISDIIHIYNNINDFNESKIDEPTQIKVDKTNRLREPSPNKKIVSSYDYCVIIPYRKRFEHLKITYDSIMKSSSLTTKKVHIIVVEHSEKPEIKEYCFINKIEYFYIPIVDHIKSISMFNRGLTFDIGVLWGLPSDSYICHDVDIYVEPTFFNNIEENVKQQNVSILQTYANRIVHRVDKITTENIHNGIQQYTDVKPENYSSPPGSWGGSIYIEKNAYYTIGGHDPDLFTGYAPEDQCIVHKILINNYEFGFANNPPINIYHQYHEPTNATNKYLDEMTNLFYYLKNNIDICKEYIENKSKFMISI